MDRIKDAVMERLRGVVEIVSDGAFDRWIKLDARYEADSDIGFGDTELCVEIMAGVLADEIRANGMTRIVDLYHSHIIINPVDLVPYVGFRLRLPGDTS